MELVENVYVSDFTKKTLEQFGWQEGNYPSLSEQTCWSTAPS